MILSTHTTISYVRCPIGQVALLLVGLCLALLFNQKVTAQTIVNLSLTADVDLGSNDPNAMPACTVFNYNLNYGVVSLDDDAINASITVPINGFDYVGFSNNPDVASVNVVGTDVIISFVSPLLAGSSGTVPLQLQFPCGTTCTGDVATLSAIFDADNASSPVQTADITMTGSSVPSSPNTYTSNKEYDFANEQYSLDLRINNTDATLDESGLYNIAFSLELPAGSNIVSCGDIRCGGGLATCTQTGTTVTWTGQIADFPSPEDWGSSSCGIDHVVVTAPQSTFPPETDFVTNFVATGDGWNNCTASYTGNDMDTYTIPALNYSIDCGGNTHVGGWDSRAIIPGGSNRRYQVDAENASNAPLYDFTIDLNVPSINYIDITSIRFSNYMYEGQQVDMYYQTNLNAVYTFGDSRTTSGTFSFPTLAVGEYITGVRYVVNGMVNANSPIADFNYRFDVLTEGRDGTPINTITYEEYVALGCYGEGASQTDCVCPVGITCITGDSFITANDVDGNQVINQASCDRQSPMVAPTYIADEEEKRLLNPAAAYNPGDTIEYQIEFDFEDNFPGDITNIMLIDTLPTGLSYAGVMSYEGSHSDIPLPVFTENNGVLVWDWSANPSPDNIVPPSDNFVVSFKAVVDIGTPAEVIMNCFDITNTNDIPAGYSNNADLCEAATIGSYASLSTVKWVKGSLDNEYSKFPDIGQTVPGENYTYRFVIINEGNVALQNMSLIDILPYIGDEAVSAAIPRNTEWTPTATSPVFFLDKINADPTLCDNMVVTQPADVTVQYSTENNPCRSDLQPSYNPTGCTGPTWNAVPPANIADLKSFILNIGGPFAPGDTMVFALEMTAPESAIPGEITWNSFAQQVQRVDNLDILPIAEPNKVGITVQAVLDVALKKKLSNTTPEPLMPSSSVTFDIWVYNQGSVLAENIQISDYIPAGLLLNDTDWSETAGIATLNTPISSIAVADSVMVSIDFTIDANYTNSTIINVAEISAVSGTSSIDGASLSDKDSMPDQDDTNDAGGQVATEADNYIDGDGTGVIGDSVAATDEDDHDPVLINITVETCTTPTATATALAASCTNSVPNNDGYIQISAATDATHYNFVQGSDYTTGDSDIANATALDINALPLQFGILPNPIGSQDYTVRVFNGASDCFVDMTVTLMEQIAPILTIDGAACDANLTTYTIDFTSDGTVTSDVGTVVGNQVTDIPVGTDANLTATSADNCTTTQVVTAPVCGCPTVDATATANPICEGSDLILQASSTSVIVGWAWAGPNGFTATEQSPIITAADTLANGTYTVTVTDDSGCTGTAETQGNVQVRLPVNEICDGQSIDVEAETGFTTYQWYKDGIAIDSANGGDQPTYTITEIGEYNYTVDGAVLDGSCINQMCCPIVIAAGDCPPDCPAVRCLPVTLTKSE